jgi:hypothetical protein
VKSAPLSAPRQTSAVEQRLASALARERTRYAVLFALGAFLSGITILQGINPHDEGIMLQAAARVAHGQLPYRDFYCNYGPGQPYLLGGLQLVFGPSLLSWRVLRVALDATVGVLAYALTRREAPEPLALAAWLAVATAMAFPSIPSPNPAAIALGLAAILLVSRSPAGAGALAGVAIAFRIDVGLAAAAGAVLAAAPCGRRAAVRAAVAAALVGGLLLAPFVVAAPGAFWDQTLGFAFNQQSLQRLPLPGAYHGSLGPNRLLEFYFPYVLLAGTALWTVVAARRRAPLGAWAPVPLAAAGVGYLLARADEFHYIPLAAVLPILLATAAARERRAGRRASTLVLVAIVAAIALYGLDRKRMQIFDSPPLATIKVDVADGVEAPTSEARSLGELVRYVRARVPPSEPVFVADPRHDIVKVGNPLVYVLLQRKNATRYDVMQPGVVTTAPVQREIVAALQRSATKLVIRWLSPVASQPEPNGAGRSSGVRILDRYLADSYVEVRRFGDYAVLRRRST